MKKGYIVIEPVQQALNERMAEIEEHCPNANFYAKPRSLPRVSMYKAQSKALTQWARAKGATVDVLMHQLLIDNLTPEQQEEYLFEVSEEAQDNIDKHIAKYK